jgi:predicted homoserine dehydrogenase-like protein
MLQQELLRRESHKKPIRVAASGAGWMGSGFVTQMSLVPGMTVNVLADSDVPKARDAFIQIGITPDNIIETDSIGQAEDALKSGKYVITGSYTLAAQLPSVDIVADVTPSPAIGAETAYACIQHGKDIVLINIEADVTVGRILNKLAQEAGILYTVSSGDEPGCLMELWNFVTMLGYEPIVIGKGKNNPLNPAATPDTVAESSRKADKDPYQTASYVDGTKTMFEMTCAANATGCLPMRRGMNGPEATLDTISEIFALEDDGGITTFPGAIDFVQGSAMAGGVFVTVRILNERINDDLKYLKVGKGKYYTFFRPYHLWFLEAPISIARAFLKRETTLVPLDRPVADVMTVAKRDLQPGDKLDDFGGYTFYGLMDRAEEVKKENALPVGLAIGAEIISPVNSGQIISWDDVKIDENSTVVKLRRQQDELSDKTSSIR